MKKYVSMALCILIIFFCTGCSKGNKDFTEQTEKAESISGSHEEQETTADCRHQCDETGLCSLCGTTIHITQGLVYELWGFNDECYLVDGIGTATDTEIVIPYTYQGKEVVRIGDHAFEDCAFITSVILPDSIEEIGVEAFAGCSGLKHITIPEYFYKIERNAFTGCSSLSEIQLPDKTSRLDDSAFEDCTSLKEFTVPRSCREISSETFKNSGIQTIVLHQNVQLLAYNCFEGCRSLVSITYNGTMQQWEDMKKLSPWGSDAIECIVHCTDGDVMI